MTVKNAGISSLLFVLLSCGSAVVVDGDDSDVVTGSACQPNSSLCNGSELWVCNPQGTDYNKLSCRQGCQNAQCMGSTCTPNSKKCTSEKLASHCDANGVEQLFVCDNLCLNGDCQNIQCIAGLQFCEPGGNKILVCSPDGMNVTDLKSCPHGCNPATVQCMDPVCQPEQSRCSPQNPLRVEQCLADRSGFELTNILCEEECINGQCKVSACIPDTKRCGLGGVEICMSSGQAYKPYESCQYGCMESNDGDALCAKCPGKLIGAGSNNPTWQGAYRCNGQDIQYCEKPFSPWKTIKVCDAVDSCANATCVPVLTLTDANTTDKNRMLLTEALGKCWTYMKSGKGGKKEVCRSIDGQLLGYNITKGDLIDWFCAGHKEGNINADSLGGQETLDAAHELMGCGFLNVVDVSFETIGKKVTGGLSGVECIAYEDNEIIVGLCGDL